MDRKIFLIFVSALVAVSSVYAGPSSTNFELKDYNFGAGGTDDATSSNYSLFGIAGEIAQGDLDSSNFGIGGGLPNTIMPNLPGSPTFTNPGDYYDRLQIIIDPSGNSTDTTYAIAITESTDTTWSNTRYIQSDNSVGTILGIEDFQTYSLWGGATGQFITNLAQNTEYKVRVKARQGNFTETGWGASSTATTSVPSLSFGVDSNIIEFDQLSSGNSFTDSSKNTVLTTSTNAYYGYIVYAHATQPLTSNTNTVSHYGSTNSTPSTWTGNGFGYTTSDNELIGGVADRFVNGGAKFAGFTQSSPGDPVADTQGPISTPIVDEEYTVSYLITTPETQPAGLYQTTILYIVVPTF